jgi:hypothetical protein
MSKSYKKQTDPLVYKNTKTRTYDRFERKNLNQQIRTMKYSTSIVDPEDIDDWDEEDDSWEFEDNDRS